MATTATTTATTTMLVGVLPTMTSAMDATSENHCPACGQDVHRPSADAAQQRIKELEAEVQRLTEGATLTGRADRQNSPSPWKKNKKDKRTKKPFSCMEKMYIILITANSHFSPKTNSKETRRL